MVLRSKRLPSTTKKVGTKQVTKQLDDLARQIVRSRGRCERCGKTDKLQWAHIVTRGAKRIRWDLDNAMCLCQGCHYLFTNQSWRWPTFIDEHFGEGHYMSLHRRANDFSYKVDHQAILEKLLQISNTK